MSQGSQYSDLLPARLLTPKLTEGTNFFRSTQMGSAAHPSPYRKGKEGFPR